MNYGNHMFKLSYMFKPILIMELTSISPPQRSEPPFEVRQYYRILCYYITI